MVDGKSAKSQPADSVAGAPSTRWYVPEPSGQTRKQCHQRPVESSPGHRKGSAHQLISYGGARADLRGQVGGPVYGVGSNRKLVVIGIYHSGDRYIREGPRLRPSCLSGAHPGTPSDRIVSTQRIQSRDDDHGARCPRQCQQCRNESHDAELIVAAERRHHLSR